MLDPALTEEPISYLKVSCIVCKLSLLCLSCIVAAISRFRRYVCESLLAIVLRRMTHTFLPRRVSVGSVFCGNCVC